MLPINIPHGVKLIAQSLQTVMTFGINSTLFLFSWWSKQSYGFFYCWEIKCSVPKLVTRVRTSTWFGAFIFFSTDFLLVSDLHCRGLVFFPPASNWPHRFLWLTEIFKNKPSNVWILKYQLQFHDQLLEGIPHTLSAMERSTPLLIRVQVNISSRKLPLIPKPDLIHVPGFELLIPEALLSPSHKTHTDPRL